MALPREIDRIGPYELLEPIGEGGFARVYRVRRGSEELAAKVLAPAAPSADPAAVERFDREIRVLSGIKHPNLIELVDHGVDDALGPYMITRLVTGMTLRELAAGRPLSPEAAILLVEPVLRALGAMHAVGLVHRDLKPENVMVTPLGEVVLVDLGLALHGAHSRLTEAGTVTGSVPYMSPEQVEGDAIGPSADVWALGVTLYELVAGRRPFQRERAGEELASILAAAHERLADVDRRVAKELDDFVERCLARDASARFADAASALEALHECVDWITPKQMRSERAAVVTDPHRYGERAADRRVALSCEQAREHLARGDDFEALRVLDRALSYKPDDERVLALVARASGARESVEPTTREEAPRGAGAIYGALRSTTRAVPNAPVVSSHDRPGRSRWRTIGMAAGLVALGAALAAVALVAIDRDDDDASATVEREPASEGSPAEDRDAIESSPLLPLAPADLGALRPIPTTILSNDDPPRENRDIARSGEPLVPPRALGPDGPAAGLASIEAQLRDRPGDVELEVGRALALLGNDREREGLAELDRLAREHPELATVWGARGYVAYRQGHVEDAERFLSRSIELEPASAVDLRNRGILRSKQGRTRDAYADLVAALRYDPDDVEALTELAQIYERADRRMDARPLLERVVRLRPDNVVAWVDLSMTQPDPADALASVRRALAIDPDYVRAHTRLCRLLAQRNGTEAIDACTRAAQLAPNDGAVYMHRGLAHYYLGHTDEALRDLDRAAELDASDPVVFTNRYLVRTHAGETALAREDLRRACDLHHAPACAELRRSR